MPSIVHVENTILSVLKTDPNKVWEDEESLTDHVVNILGLGPKKTEHVQFPLWAMVYTKRIRGFIDERTQWITRLQYEPNPPIVSQADVDKATKELKDELKSQKTLTQAAIDAGERLSNQLKEKPKDRIIEVQVKNGDKVVKRLRNELFHPVFERTLALARARRPIYLVGPTGSGKTHLGEQVSKALNLPFGFISCTAGMSEGQLGGRLLPIGTHGQFDYVVSEFVSVFEGGGVFLADEFDAGDSNVMLVINSALANGKISLPNRPKKPYALRHKDFVFIAAANTVGNGADRMYSGRNRQDGATLDRFNAGKVFVDYDKNLEKELCVNEHGKTYAEFLDKCWEIRKAIRDNRLERAMSTRFIVDGAIMKREAEWSDEELFGDTTHGFYTGWREDEYNQVRSALSL